jgi:hypothetical protein
MFYFKDKALWSANTDGSNKFKLADNVYSYLRVGFSTLVYTQVVGEGSGDVMRLKMLQVSNTGTPVRDAVLDMSIFVGKSGEDPKLGPSDKYGVDSRVVGFMAVSPDGTMVAYPKGNYSGPTFEGMTGTERPSELWVADLNPQNPNARRLVPNDKDYITNPVWSSDGNRISFVRTDIFGTGAGYPTSIWSVYKDGTRLSFLTGPDLGKIDGKSYNAGPAFDFRWMNPMQLAFNSNSMHSVTLWLHDLTAGSDFPRPLALDMRSRALFCDSVRRYVYIKTGPPDYKAQGLYSVEVDKPGSSGGVPPQILLDKEAEDIVTCSGDSVIYTDAQGQLYLQKMKNDGVAVGTRQKLSTSAGKQDRALAVFSPDRSYIAVYNPAADKPMSFYRADGSAVPVGGNMPKLTGFYLEWINDQVVALVGTPDYKGYQLVTVDVKNPVAIPAENSGVRLNLVSTTYQWR